MPARFPTRLPVSVSSPPSFRCFVAVPRKFLPPVIERHVLGTGLALSQLLLGLVMAGLAAWVMVWAPHIAARDAAHYSGLVVSSSATRIHPSAEAPPARTQVQQNFLCSRGLHGTQGT